MLYSTNNDGERNKDDIYGRKGGGGEESAVNETNANQGTMKSSIERKICTDILQRQ
jgi:hypothetical protein